MSPRKPREKRLQEFTQELPVLLTEVELLDRGNDLATVDSLIRDEASHAKAVKDELKQRMANLELRRSTLARVVREKREPRPVQCEGWARFAEGIYEVVRIDTGEVVPGTRRRLNDGEAQGTFEDLVAEEP